MRPILSQYSHSSNVHIFFQIRHSLCPPRLDEKKMKSTLSKFLQLYFFQGYTGNKSESDSSNQVVDGISPPDSGKHDIGEHDSNKHNSGEHDSG